jgi:heat-inducible transcriptional repressor
MSNLTVRQKHLFRWVVQRYIGTAAPVGSDQLVRYCKLDCSPATVRNEMVCLEEMGFVKQPHTSAGRVPTDRGYRFFVDSLMKREDLDPQEEHQIEERVRNADGNVPRLLETLSKVMGAYSEELALVITPCISQAVFDRLELIGLAERKVLLAVHLTDRRTRTAILQTENEVDEKELGKTASFINERLSGLTLVEIQRSIGSRLGLTPEGGKDIVHRVAEAGKDGFHFPGAPEIHSSGTQHMLSQPEFSDPSLLRSILSFMEDRDGVMNVFNRKPRPVAVAIGSENQDERLVGFSVISARYLMGSENGLIGVIGPTRMRYGRILPLVSHMARTVTGFFS